MKFYSDGERLALYHGDCLQLMEGFPDESVDAIVTDPPYGLSFMDKEWDHGVPGEPFWRAVLRVAKPGAHMLVFGGTRTFHRLGTAIEDAGWEIRDTIMWVYGSGFPKSFDVSKDMDRLTGATREVIGMHPSPASPARVKTMGRPEQSGSGWQDAPVITAPSTEDAKRWEGWGTALKPAWEPIWVARKPFKGTVAANVLKNGTGALNIDGLPSGDS